MKFGLFTVKIIIFGILILFFVLPAQAGIIAYNESIVRCGAKIYWTTPCTICDLPVMVKNISDYTAFYIGIPLAGLMFVVAGVFYLISFGNPQRLNTAKSIIHATLTGLLIIFLAWLFIDEIMLVLTGAHNFKNLAQPWNQIDSNNSVLCQ